jgi:hypothetical protein
VRTFLKHRKQASYSALILHEFALNVLSTVQKTVKHRLLTLYINPCTKARLHEKKAVYFKGLFRVLCFKLQFSCFYLLAIAFSGCKSTCMIPDNNKHLRVTIQREPVPERYCQKIFKKTPNLQTLKEFIYG